MATAAARTARVGTPLAVSVWTEDDAKFASGTMALPKNLPPRFGFTGRCSVALQR
jgi:hypothetical protein